MDYLEQKKPIYTQTAHIRFASIKKMDCQSKNNYSSKYRRVSDIYQEMITTNLDIYIDGVPNPSALMMFGIDLTVHTIV